MENGNEVWRVEGGSHEHEDETWEYCVFANSAEMAEKAGLKLAKKDKFAKPYCRCAEFHCYVY